MGIISDGPFASFRHKIHSQHHRTLKKSHGNNQTSAHRRNASNNSSTPSTSSGSTAATSVNSPTTTTVAIDPLDPRMDQQQQKWHYEQQREEAREIWKRTLPLIRNDWEWLYAPQSTTATATATATSTSHSVDAGSDRGPRIDTSQAYVERTLSTPDDASIDIKGTTAASKLKRKRETRTAVLEEAEWNQGLRLFEQRRKAWTGAVDVFLPEAHATDHDAVAAMVQNPQDSLAAVQREHDAGLADGASPDGLAVDTSNFDATTNPWGTTLLPLYSATLPENFSLTRPLPSTAAEKVLYRHLVIDGKTAVAPMPLANVVRACVTGLQEADSWPPKPSTVDPLAGKVNKAKRRHKIKSLLGITNDKEMDDGMGILNEPGARAGEAGFETSN